MSEEFVVGQIITWVDSVWGADNEVGYVKHYLTGKIKRITPYTAVIELKRDGEPAEYRFSKYQIAEGVEDWELKQTILKSAVPAPKAEDTREHVVYALSDPRTSIVHYVGISKNIRARFKQHLTCSGTNLQKNVWVLQLLQQGMQPTLTIIETVRGSRSARERETYWVQHYLEQGAPLTNVIESTGRTGE